VTGEPGGSPSSLTLRLAAAFLTVAVVAVGVLAALIVLTADRQTGDLLDRQHRDAATAAASLAAAAFQAAGGWTGADLTAVAAVAASAQARLVLADPDGALLAAPTDDLAGMMARMHGVTTLDQPRGHPVVAPVLLDGRTVGFVSLTFPLAHDTPAGQVRTALWRTAVAGTALAAAVALAIAMLVAARLTRPLVALTDAAGRLAAGERSARADVHGPGELGVLAVAFDDMASQLEDEDRLRQQLLTDVAHELRTPLAILQGETEALLDGLATPDAATLGSLHDEVGRLARLVADLETLSAADAAHLALHLQVVDLADVAGRAAATMRTAATEAGLSLTCDLAAAPALGDPDRIEQIVLNLLSNAVKFTPAPGTVTVTTRVVGDLAELHVTDTGPGLSAGEEAHVFERFWRGSAGRTTAGSGVGLAVAAELAAAHHGTLTVTGAGPGATFVLQLPARRGPATRPSGQAASRSRGASVG
jgi:two-component system, OmpR family, sensor histidine kinase BaeS